jgi:hypothetical protein
MAARYTVYTALPDNPSDPRITDLQRPLRVPGSGIGAPGTLPGGYPVNGTSNTGQVTSSGGGAVSASDAAGAAPVVVLDNYKNRNQTSTSPFQLVANVPTRLLPGNLRRTGIILQNADPTANLWFAFGNTVTFTGFFLPPGGIALFDFTTPRDDLWVMSNFNILGTVAEMTRGPT